MLVTDRTSASGCSDVEAYVSGGRVLLSVDAKPSGSVTPVALLAGAINRTAVA